jgi:hypothetical protein
MCIFLNGQYDSSNDSPESENSNDDDDNQDLATRVEQRVNSTDKPKNVLSIFSDTTWAVPTHRTSAATGCAFRMLRAARVQTTTTRPLFEDRPCDWQKQLRLSPQQ